MTLICVFWEDPAGIYTKRDDQSNHKQTPGRGRREWRERAFGGEVGQTSEAWDGTIGEDMMMDVVCVLF